MRGVIRENLTTNYISSVFSPVGYYNGSAGVGYAILPFTLGEFGQLRNLAPNIRYIWIRVPYTLSMDVKIIYSGCCLCIYAPPDGS